MDGFVACRNAAGNLVCTIHSTGPKTAFGMHLRISTNLRTDTNLCVVIDIAAHGLLLPGIVNLEHEVNRSQDFYFAGFLSGQDCNVSGCVSDLVSGVFNILPNGWI